MGIWGNPVAVTTVAGVAEWVGFTSSIYGSAIYPALVGAKSGQNVGLDNFPDPKFGLGRINFLIYVYGVKEELPA
ncbi:hypothetical protein UF75_0605 [Desulfosporosinus sp. I2]|nr:hypothetical protein UF75_0605 [Desulfosporosinus sp. I2]